MGTGAKSAAKRPAAKVGQGGQTSLNAWFTKASQPRVVPVVATVSSSDVEIQDASEREATASQTSDYVDTAKESEATSSDFAPTDERGQTTAESEKATSDDEDIIPVPKASKPKRQKTLFGGIMPDEDEALDLEPASRPTKLKTAARNHDAWQYKGGIDETLPPMHDLGEIFEDIAKNSVKHGLQEAVGHLASKKLRIATMCSGTESPVLALDLIRDSE
jgi:hypothetical protein